MLKRLISSLTLFVLLFSAACTPTADLPDYTRYVDPRIGSGDHGHVFVGANVPFGFVQLGPTSIPQTWDWCSGYNIADTTVIGFGHTHLSGTGIGDLNDISLMPLLGTVRLGRGVAEDPESGMWSTFSHSRETAEPGYYSTRLDRYGIDVELTATTRTGMSRYTFPASDAASIVIDLENGQGWDKSTDCGLRVIDSVTVEGWRYSTGWAKDQRIWFSAIFSKPFERVAFEGADSLVADRAQGEKLYGQFFFRTTDREQILVKVGLSAVSAENARLNLDTESPDWDFEGIRLKAHDAWNAELSKIQIETADTTVRKVFYTALYHTMIAPSVFNDVNGDYRGSDAQMHHDTTFTNYTTFSLWDTYRAAHPLLTLVQPERVNDIIRTMLTIYDEQGKLPVWHLMGCETDCMVGNPAIPVVADAMLKGFDGFDAQKAYEAMKTSAMLDERGLDLYKKYGYIPLEFNESIGHAMEYAIADGALARVAAARGEQADSAYFTARSQVYRHYFDPSTRFIRAKSAAGEWRTPFDPFHSRHLAQDYTEGNAWQYTWLVPHDVPGLVECFGGRESFLEKLDSLFVVEGDMGAEASPDISGLIGQYAHGNEPSHHITYLYTMLGEPAKTADRVRQVLTTLYHDAPAGLCGNEDVGQMSAWYVLSSLGIYQVEPAGGRYYFGSPLIDRATIRVKGGTLTVEARNNSLENKYIQSVSFNGKPLKEYWIDYRDLSAGGSLVFEMGNQPADWTK